MSDQHALARIESLLLIAIGGFAGANLRYFVGRFYPGVLGTFVANVTGSFLLGLLLYEAMYAGNIDPKTRVVLGTGFLSSYTTYSTFALETVTSSQAVGVMNVLANYVFGFAAVVAGGFAASLLRGESE